MRPMTDATGMLARLAIAAAALAGLLLALAAGAPGEAKAAEDPPACTQTIQYDPTVPTFAQVAAQAGNFTTNNGQSTNTLGGFQTGTNNRHPSADLYAYQQAIADATAGNPRIRVVTQQIGTTFGNRPFKIAIVGTPEHVANVENDAAFWRGVRDGSISEAEAMATLDSGDAPPAFAWITETPHGNEPAGGEASMRMLYELAARTDCANMRRLDNMTVFIDPARNPDGRDNNTRTSAYSFDPNRDLAFQTQDVNTQALDEINQYPGLFFIDAHQQTSGYFFPPNEDPVLHEISHFALSTIQDVIGPALQQRFNDQGLQYRNYNAYDLFANEYGDAGPSLFMGAAGMTYEKGSNEVYGKQVYDHYLAMDETLNVISREKDELSKEWAAQWQEAADQGADCTLQENVLVSPLHTPPSGEIAQQPSYDICGYYLQAGQNSGDVARVVDLLRGRDVKVYRLDQPVTVGGAHDFGETGTETKTLPAGTLWIPAAQTMKHWLHSAMEEDPFIPYPYFYDVVNWSFPELFSLGGGGQLQAQMPGGAQMTELTGPTQLGGVTGASSPVLAFATDSSKALGLITQLLDGGATVYRGRDAFDAGGTHFPTGTALVDASTVGSMDVGAMARAAQTPVVGLPSYPVPRYAVGAPKIALYTGGGAAPPNPVFNTAPNNHCTSTAYCEMVFAMARELNVPVSRLVQFTSADLLAGNLVSQNFTAIVNPGSNISVAQGATQLQTFINGGGNYVGYNANGATTLRNAGVTALNTSATNVPPFTSHCPDNADPTAAGQLTTPGTAFNATFDTTDPVAWGFDEGGYIYRDSSNNPVFDGATLTNGAKAAVSFADPLHAYGYSCNATVSGALPGRPYAVDQPFGLGHATVLGSNAFFRGWTAGAQRLVMNGVLYPTAAAISPPAPPAQTDGVLVPAGKKIPKAKLKKVKSRPVTRSHNPLTDAVITVRAKQAKKLSRIVKKAKAPGKVRRAMRWTKRGNRVTLTIKGASRFARTTPGDPKQTQLWTYGDLEMRPEWAWRIIRGMTRHHVKPIAHEI
jgi:hypothetical protein